MGVITNRSVQTDSALPHVVYDHVGEACRWLCERLGFEELYRYGDPQHPAGAQLKLGLATLMIESARQRRSTPQAAGALTQYVTLFVEDATVTHAKVRGQGVRIVEELNETAYGELQFVIEDFAGHRWIFSQHIRDVSPSDWGATMR